MSVSALVAHRVSRLQKGTPFTIEGFYALGSVTSVQKAMSRLAQEGTVVRVAKGIYARPKPLKSFPSIQTSATAEEVAWSWARNHNYALVPQGLEEAYRLGLQTQAPVKTVFWSSGPSREFKVGNQQVVVKHTAHSKLRWANKPEGAFYRALLVLSAEHTPLQHLKAALKRLNLTSNEVIPVIRKLKLQPTLISWQNKLTMLESELLS
ncbi:DUF6088 family protein [Alkalimonas collagenimarina]|uniref:DUF6088 family protein n=1 Tax=Alkalimonas collagenimarina TaxID=400390 RepID=A0ABT9H0S6_9GAMM|nr:DUF6088 family protein [Alkalimonas collagenimarina]MDP4536906.1 DUF6088 family protein [Alkalimonas collagenimarina]